MPKRVAVFAISLDRISAAKGQALERPGKDGTAL